MKLDELFRLVRTLRAECPWDRSQTLRSLKGKVIEEAYELVEAISEDNIRAITEEIGDVIFLAMFLARILEEEGKSDFAQIIESTISKYRSKHPHVFEDKELKDASAVLEFWHKSKDDIFNGIPEILPALLAAKVIQERTAKIGFDWPTHKGPLDKVREELRELEMEGDPGRQEEIGDLLFACVNLARHLKIDPEDALRDANKKFVGRFRKVLEELKRKGRDIDSAALEELDAIWDEIKKRE
ncbi:MAG: nucleoside triphosphate pyrophosphohydrolase [candidate division WOR-3 bacterium]|nr:MAG: nucleoside triphosphate pyrophosphohydrolase [candidate division WOR-3 bacterium]